MPGNAEGDLAFLDYGIVGVLRRHKRQVFDGLPPGFPDRDVDACM